MSMRTHRLTTHLRPEEAHTLVEFLDQVRDMLMEAYGDDIRAMLREATTRHDRPGDRFDDDPVF